MSAPPAARGGFTEGPIRNHVARMSGVMILGFLAMTIGALIETAYLGLVGARELAAIAFTFPVAMALNALTRGIGIGASSLLAPAMGAGDQDRAALIISHCFILITLFTVSVSVAGFMTAEWIFGTLGARGEVLDLIVRYVAIWFVGFPALGLAMISNGLIRAFGDAVFPGYIMATGPAVQVVLGPFLIFGWLGFPALGIVGAGVAFAIGAFAQLALALWWFGIRERLFRATLVDFARSSIEILHVGIPAAGTNLIQPLSAAVITWLLASHGDTVVAGFGVATRIEAVVSMVVIGISTSVVPLVGQNWGAGLYDRVREALRVCYQASLAWGMIAAAIMWMGAATFIGWISDDDEVMTVATTYLYIVPVTIGFMGLMTVATHAFNALRRPGPALILSVARLVVVYIPLALVASRMYGYIGVFTATAATNVLIGIIAVAWFHRVLGLEQARRSAAAVPA